MKPCISEATTLPLSFAEDVNTYADAGCTAMEVWLTKLENHLDKHSVADTQKLLRDRGMTLAAAAYQGGLLLSQGEQRKAHYDHFPSGSTCARRSASARCSSWRISSSRSSRSRLSGRSCR